MRESVAEGKINVDHSLGIVKREEFGHNFVYSGQMRSLESLFIGKLTYDNSRDGTQKLAEGVWKLEKAGRSSFFLHGPGRIIQTTCVSEGEFKQDKLDGYGKRIYTDGRVKEGLWKDGKFQG